MKAVVGLQRAGQLQDEAARRKQRNNIDDLEARVAELSLACEALWTLLAETAGLTEAHLMARIRDLDLQDGVVDRRRAHLPVDCVECNSKVSNRATMCTFCGAPAPTRSPFS